MSTVEEYLKFGLHAGKFVKFPRQIDKRMINQAWKDGLLCAKYMKIGKWMAVIAAGKRMFAMQGNSIIFDTEETCASACIAANVWHGYTNDESAEIIEYSNDQK